MRGVLMLALGLLLIARTEAQRQDGPLVPGGRVHLHAHNAYPDQGRWRDRIERALAAGVPHLAIEQDVAWAPPQPGRPGRSVVTHDVPARGDESDLEQHFFARVEPIMLKALAEQKVGTWPVLVLHLDFKTNEPEHHRYIWELLGRHEAWLTTAERTASGTAPSALRIGPLLVLTENGEGQEWHFHLTHPVGARLRLFGTVPPADVEWPRHAGARAAAMVATPVEALVPSGATSYRRWTNHSWGVVESGGPPGAGAWTPGDQQRLRAIVKRAHTLGLWVRFYGLNGHQPPGDGWSAGYNFGSEHAAQLRWRAAMDAGVDFIATDQYEALAATLRTGAGGALR